MIIEINALDTLFFRDGKPFTMGEDTWANGVFPPYPSVIYGALRSVYFSNHIEELPKANTKEDPTKNLKIKRIFLKISNEVFSPLPLDCVKEKDSDKNECFVLYPESKKGFISNYPELEQILTYSDNGRNRKIEKISDAVLSKLDFENYLKGINVSYLKLDKKFIITEPKIGIGRSSVTRSSEKGKLYRVDMKRLRNVSFLIDFEGLNLPGKGMMKLGGEGKAASYQKYPNNIEIEFPEFADNEKQFKVVLTTPTIFKNGWLPGWIDEKTLSGEYKGIKLKLLTVSIGKPIHIGGFDMKKRRPKPMFKAVPAGSVYYFELQEGTKGDIKRAFHQRAISDVYSEQGFGIAYVGGVKGE